MVPDDQLTAEPALTVEEFSALKVTSASQAASSGGTSIKSPAESVENGRLCKLQPSKRLETKEKQAGNMSETVTQYKNHHLWLSAEPGLHVQATTTTTTMAPVPRRVSRHHDDSEVIIRSPTDITLDVTVRVGGKAAASASAFNVAVSAGKCSLLSDLRAHIVGTDSGSGPGSSDARVRDATTLGNKDGRPGGSLLHLIRDLRKVTFRLEEDGHIAKLNITRTRIDASCVFPETEYEAWYYRNVLRGKQRVYTVEVNIEA